MGPKEHEHAEADEELVHEQGRQEQDDGHEGQGQMIGPRGEASAHSL